MNCSAFEDRLTQLLGGELAEPDAKAALDALRGHAETCPGCGASEAWIELAALPAGDRDPLPDPGEAYWSTFNTRVASRIEVVPARARPRWRPWAVAASLVLALATGWSLRGWLTPAPAPEPVAGVESEAATDWTSLEEVIREATPEELAAALRNLPGNPGLEATDWNLDSGATADWMIGLDELDDADQTEILEWLDELQTEGRPTS